MIGIHYSKENYNCAHFVSEWYRLHLSVEIPTGNLFDRSFVVWMRRNFEVVDSPVDHCLVLMTNQDNTYHVGVYHNYGVYHNFKPIIAKGSVCHVTLGTILSYYKKVSYFKWS